VLLASSFQRWNYLSSWATRYAIRGFFTNSRNYCIFLISQFTRADITLFSMLESLSREMPSILEKFQLLATVYKKTRLRPQIEKFLSQEFRR
jgi:hypothetical protein